MKFDFCSVSRIYITGEFRNLKKDRTQISISLPTPVLPTSLSFPPLIPFPSPSLPPFCLFPPLPCHEAVLLTKLGYLELGYCKSLS